MPDLWDSPWEQTPAPVRRRGGLNSPDAPEAPGPGHRSGREPDPDGSPYVPEPRDPHGRGRRLRLGLLGLLAALALVGGGVGATLLLQDDAPGPTTAELPAATGRAQGPTTIGRIYDQTSGGVVSVRAGDGSGTGFIIRKDGTMVTNAHVVGASSEVQVRLDDDGDLLDADVIGKDPSSDLAVLKLKNGPPRALTVLPFADSDKVKVGDDAIAIGYPLGLDRTATRGIISGLKRQIDAPNGFSIDNVIQTDAPINPGNSGGPLLDAQGRVIGVNSQIATAGAGSSGNVGIGFAVPSNTVREVIPVLLRDGKVARPYLGVSTGPVTPDLAKALSLGSQDGAIVTKVNPGSPAAASGVRPADGTTGRGGDIIVGVDGQRVRDPQDVSRAIENKSPGDTVSVDVVRDGARTTVEVRLGDRPDSATP